MATSRPTLDHCRWDNLTKPMLITAYSFFFWPKFNALTHWAIFTKYSQGHIWSFKYDKSRKVLPKKNSILYVWQDLTYAFLSPNVELKGLKIVGNKAKERISSHKRWLQENKVPQTCRKTCMSHPLIRLRICVYHGVTKFLLSENLVCFVFL